MTVPLENYAMIGDGETVALVSKRGSVDWLCLPRFDSPACCTVLLGDERHGFWSLAPDGEVLEISQAYRPDPMVLMSAFHIAERAGMERTTQGQHLEQAVVDHVAKVWRAPDQGLWESRGERRHYVYSKAMAWVVLDRFLYGRGAQEVPKERRAELTTLRANMHSTICSEGFDKGLNSFTSFYGGAEVDASLLLLPKIGFLPMSDPRMVGTLAAIESRLVENGFVYQHRMDALVPEGAFLACSFWLAKCQLGAGRRADAVITIEAAIGVAGATGLLSEEYDTRSRRLTGNHLQAFSHLALIQAVLALKRFDDGERDNDADL